MPHGKTAYVKLAKGRRTAKAVRKRSCFMYARRRHEWVEVWAPAKLNLFLELLARRDDGYHELETLMVAVNLFDTLLLSANDTGHVSLSCEWSLGLQAQACRASESGERTIWERLPEGTQNLAFRAVELLRQRAGCERGADVRLTKRIPAAAGLGGASSDAAAALWAANIAWNLGWSRSQLSAVAAELGSDVAFFLEADAAVCRGRGERVEPVVVPRMHFVVVRPPEGLSTPLVYRHCRVPERPERVEELLAAMRRGDWAAMGRALHNRLQEPAERLSPWIGQVSRVFEGVDCAGHRMSGSGTSYFGLCRHARQAQHVSGCLRAAGFRAVFPVTTWRHGGGPGAIRS